MRVVRVKYSEGQERDDHGRFDGPGGSGGTDGASDESSGGGTNHAELSGLNYDKPSKTWMRSDGAPVSAETAARLKLAGIFPGYTNVSLNPDPTASLQAKGVDSKGKTQWKYSKEHSSASTAENFARLKDFSSVVVSARETLRAEMKNPKLPTSRRDAAAVVRLIEQTSVRVGSDKETKADVKAYGATTLLGDHVTLLSGGRVNLEFPGKSGVLNRASTTDPDLHRYLSAKNLKPGQRVFETNDAGVRVSMQRAMGSGFSPKDFRTWTGTAIAKAEVAKQPIPKTVKEFEKQRRTVGKVVAAHLNNNPSTALKHYIDPVVFKSWGAHA
jgi:DNA topoisomerase-1